MILDGAELGSIEHRLGYEQRHVGHHAQVGVGRLHELESLRRFPALGLVHGQALLLGKHLERILGTTRLVGRAEHRHHILLALEQLLEHGLAEGFLPMHYDPHHHASARFTSPAVAARVGIATPPPVSSALPSRPLVPRPRYHRTNSRVQRAPRRYARPTAVSASHPRATPTA